MSYKEYLAWWDEGRRGEWVDDEVIVFDSPTILHQRLVRFLLTVLDVHASSSDLGEVFLGPLEMSMRTVKSSRIPDILFVAKEHSTLVTAGRLEGPADLVVEVVSADSVVRDRAQKRHEYASAGIREYWIADPRSQPPKLHLHVLDEEGWYEETKLDTEGRVHSAVLPGLWLDPTWLWQDPLPKASTVLDLIAAGTSPSSPSNR